MNTADQAFHDHLDACERCANQPFNLCPVGAPLLLVTGERTGGTGATPQLVIPATLPAAAPELDEDLDEAEPACELCGDGFTIVRGERDQARFCDPCAQDYTAKQLPLADQCRRGRFPECVHCGHKWTQANEVFEAPELNEGSIVETSAACPACDRTVKIARIVHVFYEVTP